MLPPLATVEQLGARLGATPAGADAERAVAVLYDASALVRQQAGMNWTNEAGTALEGVPSIVEAVVLAVAYRAFQNPTGATQTSVGDVSVSYGRETVTGSIYLTRDERRAVRKAAGVSVSSIALVSPWEVLT